MSKRILTAVSALALLALAACGGTKGDRNSWKAVFLTSGQVYYGKLTKADGQFYKLQDVYYLRVNQQQQPAEGETPQPPQLSLIKLGNEIHGPEDAIYLNRDHILYIEDLKEDGQVVKAIADAKAAADNPDAPPPAMAGQPPAPTTGEAAPAAVSVPPDQMEEFRKFQEQKKGQEGAKTK